MLCHMLISCGFAYWLIIYHALPYAQICRFQVNINRCHPFSNAMNTFDLSYNGTPIANMGCYSSFDIYFFVMMELPTGGMSWLIVYHDGTPSGDVMIMNQVAVFPDTVEILCGDVHLLQFLSEDIKSNEQYKLKKTKWKSTNQYRTNTKTFVIMWNMTYSFHPIIPWTDVTFMMLFSKRQSIFIMNNVKWNSIL